MEAAILIRYCAIILFLITAVHSPGKRVEAVAGKGFREGSSDVMRSSTIKKHLVAGMDVEALNRIDDVMKTAMDNREVSGGVVLIQRKGKVVFNRAFGYRSVVPTTETATLDTIYDLASLTKVIATTSAIMKLVEWGKVRLSDPVENYLPEWKQSDEEIEQQKEIARVKRLIKAGGLRFQSGTLSLADPTTATAAANVTAEKLWDRVTSGQVHLSLKAAEKLLDFEAPDRSDITLRHLLTHTSGLDPYDNYYLKFPEGNAREKIISNIAHRKLMAPAGEAFVYSDLGFITLGEIVERVSGQNLNDFCRENVFLPLGMKDTMFNPPSELLPRIAPTEWRPPILNGPGKLREKYMIRGEVHDGNAFVQNGISGHAGLFSTAHDLSLFCQMLLNEGELNGTRVFSPLTIRAMTRDESRLETGEVRGYGWDIKTGYSGQKGDIFGSGFGHTGWTGTSIWVVPQEELFIVILTNRVHPDGSGDSGPLRARIANVVAASIIQSNVPTGENSSATSVENR
jgi:CubicO group peptidase (beta-lactamase class C family)